MTWVGLRDPVDRLFRPAGLTSPAGGAALAALMPTGTLLIEWTHDPAEMRQIILHYAVRDPWPAGLTLALDPDGHLHLTTTQQDQTRAVTLALGPLDPGACLIIGYAWDAPTRLGWLSVWQPDSARLAMLAVPAPLPLFQRDGARMMTDDRACQTGPGLVFAALADRMMPVGPMPGLSGGAAVAVPGGGQRALMALEVGDPVLTVEGRLARVAWAGHLTLPARGRFQPLFLRAPYLGLRADVLVAPDQQLRLTGTDIEYLFASEEVSVAARHLIDARAVIRVPDLAVMTWHQVMLDRPGALVVSGLAVDPFAPLRLADAPPGCLMGPSGALRLVDHGPPVLRPYEALTLRRLRAA